jgi:methionyl aminopeptidase
LLVKWINVLIKIKNKISIKKMEIAGEKLATIMKEVSTQLSVGVTTAVIDEWVAKKLKEHGLISCSKGYMGYRHVTCISVNEQVVHGVPSVTKKFKKGDLVTIDVCASWKGYCADMARCFFIGGANNKEAERLVNVAQISLDKGIECAKIGNRIGDISAAVQKEVERTGFGVVRDFAGHGIGKSLHEDPEILNYGLAGTGPLIREGMTFAIEPMITAGSYEVSVLEDGWTAQTVDGSLAAHVEDTVLVTKDGPKILTRL